MVVCVLSGDGGRAWNRTLEGTEIIHFGSWLVHCRNTQNNNSVLIISLFCNSAQQPTLFFLADIATNMRCTMEKKHLFTIKIESLQQIL